MKREYPDILNCDKEPHITQFLPDCYLYGDMTSKVTTFKEIIKLPDTINNLYSN
jgi:hypothetical protein